MCIYLKTTHPFVIDYCLKLNVFRGTMYTRSIYRHITCAFVGVLDADVFVDVATLAGC